MIGLKYLRTINELSLQQVADKIGVTKQTISKWERGIIIPKVRIEQLMEIFNIEDKQMIINEHKKFKIENAM